LQNKPILCISAVAFAAKAPYRTGSRPGQPLKKSTRGSRKFTFEDCNTETMPATRRQIAVLFAITLVPAGLSGCGTINEKLSAGMGEAIPTWAGGLPSDAPPRPGTAKYDEFMRERERRRLMPAAERDREDGKTGQNPGETALDPVH
jgi:hypothetical protein